MTSGEDVFRGLFRGLQRRARSDGAGTGKPTPTAEYLTRHALESFLDRLAHTTHASEFVLKGGILMAVYGVRRPTKDVDAAAITASISPASVEQIVRDIAAVDARDGVVFDVGSIVVQEIREGADHPGLRPGPTRPHAGQNKRESDEGGHQPSAGSGGVVGPVAVGPGFVMGSRLSATQDRSEARHDGGWSKSVTDSARAAGREQSPSSGRLVRRCRGRRVVQNKDRLL